MSADPFNFGTPNQPPPGSQGQPPASGSGGNPFGGPVPGNPLTAPSANPAPTPSSYGSAPQSRGSAPQGPFGQAPAHPGQQPPPGQQTQQGSVFGGPAAAPVDLTAAKPPTWLLFLAGGLALAAGIVAILLNIPWVAIVCWFVAGPVAIGLLALFVVKDTFARSSGLYAAPGWVKPLHYIAIGLCLLCILAPALRIADWVGHL